MGFSRISFLVFALAFWAIRSHTANACAADTAAALKKYRLKFSSTTDHAEAAAAYLKALYEVSLRERGIPPAPHSAHLELAAEEMALNAVVHGNNLDPAKFFWVTFTEDSEAVEITITDESGVFFNGLDPNERVNRLGLRARTTDESADTEGLAARRLAANHVPAREGSGGRGILLSQLIGGELEYTPHRNAAATVLGTTVKIRFPFSKLDATP